ncbi:MAG: lysophospholipid acyltransferase family protein [Gemmatimonadaceae bacterium]
MSQQDLQTLDSPPPEPADWRPGSRVPQTGNATLRRLGMTVMRVLGWQFEGAFPNREKFVAIIAPHTSNLDFPILLMAKWALNIDIRFMAKDSVFRGPVGVFMRAIGGIAVERTNAHNLVDSSVLEFSKREKLVLALAPEGTRKKVPGWKSGFWHIAKGANVPIVCVALDFRRKRIRLGPELLATEDDATIGIARVKSSYDGVIGRHPDRMC